MKNTQNIPYEETEVTNVTEPVVNQPAAAPVEKNEFEETDISMQLNNVDPIYKHKNGHYLTKAQMLRDGIDETKIQKGIDNGVITLIGDTEDLTQEFRHKNGNIFTVQEMLNDGLTQEKIIRGIENGVIFPLEKKNQVQNPLPKDISPVDAVAQVDMSTSAPPVVSPATQATASAQLNQQSQDLQALDSELKSKSTTQQRKTQTVKIDIDDVDFNEQIKKAVQIAQQKAKESLLPSTQLIKTVEQKPGNTTIQTNPDKPVLDINQADSVYSQHIAETTQQYHDYFADAISYDNDKNKKTKITKTITTGGGISSAGLGAAPQVQESIEVEIPDQVAINKANADNQEALKNGIDYDLINNYYNLAKRNMGAEELKSSMEVINDFIGRGNAMGANESMRKYLFQYNFKETWERSYGQRGTDVYNQMVPYLNNLYNKLVETTDQQQGVTATFQSPENLFNSTQALGKFLRDNLEVGANSITSEEKEAIYNNFSSVASAALSRYYAQNPEYLAADPLAKSFYNDEQIIGYRYVETMGQANKYSAALLSDEAVKDNYEARLSKQEALKQLTLIGAEVEKKYYYSRIPEHVDAIKTNGFNLENNILTTVEDVQYASDALLKNTEGLERAKIKIENINRRIADIYTNNERYGLANYYERDNLLQEILGQRYGSIPQMAFKAGKGFIDIGQGAWNYLKAPFLSDAQVTLNNASILGQNTILSNMLYLTKENSLSDKFDIAMTPEVKAEIEKIKNDPTLSYEEKMGKAQDVLRSNPDGIKLQPTGHETNISLNTLWYGATGLVGDLIPFLTVAYLTGGTGAGAAAAVEPSLLRTFSSQFTAAFLTGLQGHYADAVSRGVENPYTDAFLATTITSTAMAGAGTPDLVRKIIGTKSVVGNMINKMTDDEILVYLRRNTPALLSFDNAYKAISTVGKTTIDATLGGAKFVTYMTAAQMINDQMHDIKKDINEYIYDAKIEIIKFAFFGGVTGTAAKGAKRYIQGDFDRSVYFDIASNSKLYKEKAQKMLDENKITRTDYDQINRNIDMAAKAHKELFYVNEKGEQLTDRQKRDLLYYKMQLLDIESVASKTMPEKLKKDLVNRMMDIQGKIDQIFEGTYVTPEERQIEVLVKGDIVSGDVIKDKQGRYGQVIKVNENGSVVVRGLSGNKDRMLWKAEEIDVERFVPESQTASQPYNGAQMTPTGTPAEPTATVVEVKAIPIEVKVEKAEEILPEDNITVGDMIDKVGSYKGQRGRFYQDGQTVVFKVEGVNKEYEIGNVEQVKDRPAKDFEIQFEESVVTIDDAGGIMVRDKAYVNNFSDPVKAINRDANGNVISVNLETPSGEKRTFRGSVAEDLAYQITLKEISKDNAKRTEFEQFLNEPENRTEIDNAAVSVAAEATPVKVDATVPREKIEPVTPTTAVAEPAKPGVEAIDTEVVQKEMKPLTDRMVEIEREFENNGLEIDWDYDNEISVKNKKTGELLDVEDIPESLKEIGAEYEGLTQKLGDFDQGSFIRSLTESRKIIDVEAQVIESKTAQLPEAKTDVTAEIKEGESINFKDSGQQQKTGEKVSIPGLESIDVILVRDGMEYNAYELSTGMKIADAGGVFTKQEAIDNIAKQIESKPDIAQRLLKKIYESDTSKFGTSAVKVINKSSAYEAYKAQKQAEEQNKPFAHTEAERAEFLNLVEKAKNEGLTSAASMIEAMANQREGTSFKATIEKAQSILDQSRKKQELENRKKQNLPLPQEDIVKIDPSESALIEIIQSGYSRDRWNALPEDIKNLVIDTWKKQVAIYNKYGYYPEGFSRSITEKGAESIQSSLMKYISATLSKDKAALPEKVRKRQQELIENAEAINRIYQEEIVSGKTAEAKPSAIPETKQKDAAVTKPVVPINDKAKSKLQALKEKKAQETGASAQTPATEARVDTPLGQKIQETVVSTPEGMRATDVQVVDLTALKTDETRFQNRAQLDPVVIKNISEKWKDAEQDPIHVWRDPKNGQLYVLSGHHRYYGAVNAGRKSVKIIDRTNDFTEAQAIKFAKEEANTNRTMEKPIERAKLLRQKIERGDSAEDISAFLDKEGKNRIKVSNLSALNPDGKMMKTLEQMGESPDVQTQKEVETRADWIGEAMRTISGLTKEHENEMFDFLFDRKKSQRITTKADFIGKVRASVKPLTPAEPLNLSRFEYKTEGETVYEAEVARLKEAQNEKQAQINAINERFTNPNAEDYIPTTSKDFAEVRKVANEKIAKLEAEKKAIQGELEKLYANKRNITGGPTTGTLFSVEKTRPEDLVEMTEAVTEILKDAPEAKLTDIITEVSAIMEDRSPAMRQLIENAYNEARNNMTAEIVKDPVIRRLNRAFLKIDTQILENSQQLADLALQLKNARFSNIENSAGYETRDGKPIGFKYDTDQVARERFDLSKLKKIGEGSDRIVFDLGNGLVVKIAKTARGLEQNIYEGDYSISFLPRVKERGLNYVVVESVDRIKGSDMVPIYDLDGNTTGTVPASQMLRDLKQFTFLDFKRGNQKLQEVLAKYGLEDVRNYDDILWLDFAAARNWGYKDGVPVHLDGGTFGGVRMIENYRGIKNLEDADFRRIYNESRRLKKEFADNDRYTMFHYGKNGEILGFTHNGRIYLNGEKLTARTTAEESGHIWINNVKNTNRALYNQGILKVENSKYLQEVKNSEFYKREALKQGREGSVAYEQYMKEEALAKAIADQGAKFVTEAQKINFKNWVTAMWRNVIKAFGLREMDPAQVAKLTLEEFAKKAAADVFAKEKKKTEKAQERVTEVETITEGQRKQIIIETNHAFLYDPAPKVRQSGLMKRILESTDVDNTVKEEIKAQGVDKYSAANNAKAEAVAQQLIKTFGEADSLMIARSKDMHPSIRSALFAKLIDMAYEEGQKATTEKAKLDAANRWKDLAEEYDNELTGSGQFTAYAGHYYKISPLGLAMKENSRRQTRFDEWAQGKEKGFEEVWQELNTSEAGKAFVEAKVEEVLKKERMEQRAKRDKSIDDFFESAKLKGGTYAAVIPPAVWNRAMDIMKTAVKAGDRAVVAVQQAAEYITSQVGDSWNKEKFSKDFLSKMEQVADGSKKESAKPTYEQILGRRKAELERRMREKDYSAEEYKEKRSLTDKEQQAKDEYNEVKKAYDEARKQSPEFIEKKRIQYFDRFKSKLKGLNDKQKKEVINRSLKELVEKGALEYQEFRDIIADVLGIKELTEAEISRMKELTDTINGIDALIDKVVENPTQENIAALERGRRDAMSAGLELTQMTHREADTVGFLQSMITGSMLSLVTNLINPVQNLSAQALVRLPVSLIRQGGESIVYLLSLIGNKTLGSKVLTPTRDIISAQKGYFSKGKEGLGRAWFNFFKGTQERDYFGKASYTSQINPREAVRDLKLWREGEKFLTKGEAAERIARATIGWQADFILRSMAFGDKPFRWAAEGSEAIQIALKELKLTSDSEVAGFMAAPKEYATKILKDRGIPAEQAELMAAEYQDRIIRAGSRAVFEQENILSWLSKEIDRKVLSSNKSDAFGVRFLKGAGSLIKTSQFPFIKIPANVYWQYFKIANPEISFTQAVFNAGQALYFAKKGDKAAERRAIEDFKDNMAMGVYGASIRLALVSLASSNLVKPAEGDEQTPRERAGVATFGKSDQIDIGTLMGGDKPYWVDLKIFGAVGTSISLESSLNRERKQNALKGKQVDTELGSEFVSRLRKGSAIALNNLVFNQAQEMINAIKKGEADVNYWVAKQIGVINNIFTGSTLAAISKATMPYEVRLKSESLMSEIDNNLKYRNILYRMAAGMPPQKVSIWGKKIKKDTSFWAVVERLIGFTPQDPSQFGLILYNDFFRTFDTRFFPMPEDNKISVDGVDVKLTPEQQDALQTYVGNARTALVSPLVQEATEPFKAKIRAKRGEYNGKPGVYYQFATGVEFAPEEGEKGKTTPVKGVSSLANVTGEQETTYFYDLKYNDPRFPDEEKVRMLEDIYKYGKEIGIAQFREAYPQFAEAKITGEAIAIEAKSKIWNQALKVRMYKIAKAKGQKTPPLTPEEEEFLKQMEEAEKAATQQAPTE